VPPPEAAPAGPPEPADRPDGPEPLDRRFAVAMAVYAGLVVFVLGSQVLGSHGMLASPERLLGELKMNADTPWGLGEELPYRYRPAFRWIVLGLFAALPLDQDPGVFFGLFVTASGAALLFAVWMLDWLMRELGFGPSEALLGGILFLVGFPVLFSHDIPVQTREDFLGYAWIALTLVFVARDEPYPVAALGVVGAWIRETCLLGVLPLWLVSKRPTQERVLAYVAPAVSLLAVRLVQGLGEYDYVGVSTEPTLRWPGEAAIYLFATFGALWVAAALRLLDREAPRHPLLGPWPVGLALLAVAATGWTMGMIRENRITYVLFPFAVPLAVAFLRSPRAAAVARSRAAWASGLVVFGLGVGGLLWLGADPSRINGLRPVIGENLHLGVAPRAEIEGTTGEARSVDLTYVIRDGVPLPDPPPESLFLSASPASGPYLLVHLAVAAFLVGGFVATRGRGPAEAAAADPAP